MHPHKMWPDDSLSPQKSHLSFVKTIRCSRHCFLGSTFLQALHIKCLNLFGHCKFHMTFHIAVILELLEQPGLSFLPLVLTRYSDAILYAFLTMNMPFGDFAHIWESNGFMGLTGMLRIASASLGRKVHLIKVTSHSAFSYTIRLSTFTPLPIEGSISPPRF